MSENGPAVDPRERFERALALRDTLRNRITFWERRRAQLALPLAAVGLGLGWLVGHGLRVALGLDPRADWLVAVVGLVAFGRAVSLWVEPRQLEVAQRRVERLRAGLDKKP